MPAGKGVYAMKRILTCLLALCIVTVYASALVPENTNAYNSQIHTEGINNVAEDQAEMLNALDLLLGTGKGFELQRSLTRAEAAALLVRFLGEEGAALAQENSHPFTDVPAWADGYVGWLYQNEITKGVSQTLYGSERPVTYEQFATLLSRICSESDDFLAFGIGTEDERQRCEGETGFFHRGDAVGMLSRFLGCPYEKGSQCHRTMALFLIEKDVFSAEQLFEVGVKIYPVSYGYLEDGGLTAALLGVDMAASALKGISGNTAYPLTELPYFYAWTFGEEETVLYRLDCLTLEETEILRMDAASSDAARGVEHYATVGGRDYLGVRLNGGACLVRVDGEDAELLAEGKEFGFSYLKYSKPYIWHDNVLVVALDETVHVVTQDGESAHFLEPGAELVAVADSHAVLYREEDGQAVIEGVRMADWTVTDTYRAALPETDLFLAIRQRESGIYGEAGLFFVRDGRLIRATERPVLDVSYVRYAASGLPVILTHGPDSFAGDTIIVLRDPYYSDTDDWAEEIRLSNDPPHGIAITDISGADSAVFFYARHPVGMGHEDVFTYMTLYNTEEDHEGILVYSFAPGRPEVMEHDNQWYVEREQERLNALGYNT